MPQRFHIPPENWSADALCLDGDEARHCAQVLRHRAGDEILVFDGAGHEADCRIVDITKHRIALDLIRQRDVPAPPFRITLAAALIKNDAWEWLVEKATELGVSDLQPLIAERGVVNLKKDDIPRKLEKWRRLMLETCKQCQRAWMPVLHGPRPLAEVLAARKHDLVLIAALTERTNTIRSALDARRSSAGAAPRSVLILIGPEGDFSPAEEKTAIASGAQPVTLGPNVLRAETAATVAVAITSEELR